MPDGPTDDELVDWIRQGLLAIASELLEARAELLAARALLREAAEALASVDEDACAYCGEQRMTSPAERQPLIARLRAAGEEA